MSKQLIFTLILFMLGLPMVYSQAKLKPSQRYSSGEVVYGARAGVKTVIPQGWLGMLPRDTELFLLMPVDGSNGEIYVTVSGNLNKEERKANWLSGLDLGNGNVLRSDGNFMDRNGNLSSFLKLDQKTSTDRGYIETVCGPYGVCLTVTLLGGEAGFDKLQEAVYYFIDNIKWQEPSNKGDYDDFDWNEFLSGKHLLNYDYVPNAKAENDIWLCSDGTFTTKLKRSGLLKDQAKEYKGTKTGTWETSSVGQSGVLILNYKKLDPLKVSLKIDDEQIYLNEKRHFVMKSSVCE
jgi:hypothetical protein